jgi:TonB family protein
MFPLLALAASFMAPNGEVPPAPPPAHRARGNLASYILDSDYPRDAIQRNEQGVTGFSLDVDTAGRVSDCRVTATSGSASLDEATCRIFRARAQCEPARDRQGRPVPDRIDSRMRWVLPDRDSSSRARTNLASYLSDADYPAEAARNGQEGTVGFQLSIRPDGLVSGCRIVSSSTYRALDDATCRLMRARARFAPAHDAAGNAIADTVTSRIRWMLPPSQLDLTPFLRMADYPAEARPQRGSALVLVLMHVSAEGRVTQCEVSRPSYSAALDARTCEIAQARAHFPPPRDGAGNAIPRMYYGIARWGIPLP